MGRPCSEETKRKIGEANKGKKHPHTDATKQRLSDAQKAAWEGVSCRPLSDGGRKKKSEALKQRWVAWREARGSRKCSKCGSEGPFFINKSNWDGLSCWCQTCARAAGKSWRDRKGRNYNLLRLCGISEAEWDTQFELQGRCCAICGSKDPQDKNWHTDHNHVTGKFRGILCKPCNIAVGWLFDSVDASKRLVEYLEKHAHQAQSGGLRARGHLSGDAFPASFDGFPELHPLPVATGQSGLSRQPRPVAGAREHPCL